MAPFTIKRNGALIELTEEELVLAAQYQKEKSDREWIESLIKEELDEEDIPYDAIDMEAAVSKVYAAYYEQADFENDNSFSYEVPVYDIIREELANIMAG